MTDTGSFKLYQDPGRPTQFRWDEFYYDVDPGGEEAVDYGAYLYRHRLYGSTVPKLPQDQYTTLMRKYLAIKDHCLNHGWTNNARIQTEEIMKKCLIGHEIP